METLNSKKVRRSVTVIIPVTNARQEEAQTMVAPVIVTATKGQTAPIQVIASN
jgi:hypothetical protein